MSKRVMQSPPCSKTVSLWCFFILFYPLFFLFFFVLYYYPTFLSFSSIPVQSIPWHVTHCLLNESPKVTPVGRLNDSRRSEPLLRFSTLSCARTRDFSTRASLSRTRSRLQVGRPEREPQRNHTCRRRQTPNLDWSVIIFGPPGNS